VIFSTDLYCVATETDHVSPWSSVYRLLLLTDTDVTFVLTNGAHNSGILSEPGHNGRHFRFGHKAEGDAYATDDNWLAHHKPRKGPWWQHWVRWLRKRSRRSTKPRAGDIPSLEPAPGLCVDG
jgi:polyhydroxyalkanoate synthase